MNLKTDYYLGGHYDNIQFVIHFIMSIIITPFVIKLAKDWCNRCTYERKVHVKIMPRLVVWVYISFIMGTFFL